MSTNNRCRQLTEAMERDLTQPDERIARANAEHDRKYGFMPGTSACYNNLRWSPGYVIAHPLGKKATPEQIFEYHRQT